MDQLIREVDLVVVLVLASVFDEGSTERFLSRLDELKPIRKGRKTVALVANRIRPRSKATRRLESFLERLGQPIAARLSDRAVYGELAAQGLSVFDVDGRRGAPGPGGMAPAPNTIDGIACEAGTLAMWAVAWLSSAPSGAVVPTRRSAVRPSRLAGGHASGSSPGRAFTGFEAVSASDAAASAALPADPRRARLLRGRLRRGYGRRCPAAGPPGGGALQRGPELPRGEYPRRREVVRGGRAPAPLLAMGDVRGQVMAAYSY